MNYNLVREGRKYDIEAIQTRLNTTLTGDPVIQDNVIAFLLDGSFISQNDNSNTA
jgi:hypothetical protein